MMPIGLTITGGNEVSWDPERTRVTVPKRDLVNSLQVLSQSNRLKVTKGLKFACELFQELQNFRAKINIRTGHDSYESVRESVHDDLVLSVSWAAWTGENRYGDMRASARFIGNGRSK